MTRSYVHIPHRSQVLFSAGDIVAAWLIVLVLRRQGASETAVLMASAAWLCNPFTATISTRGSCDVLAAVLLLMLLLLLLTGAPDRQRIRPAGSGSGSGPEEAPGSVLRGRLGTIAVLSAALVYGLVVHLRIYPIIFAPTIVLFLASRSMNPYASEIQMQSMTGAAG